MYQVILRLFLSVCGLGLADYLLDGVRFERIETMFGAALLLGVANVVVRPLLVLLTLPITVLTLGVFLLAINAAMLGLVAAVLPGLHIDDFWSALLAWFIVAFIQALGSLVRGKHI